MYTYIGIDENGVYIISIYECFPHFIWKVYIAVGEN